MSHLTYYANEGLLAYGITTNPDPIQASPEQGNPAMASIVITVSNNTSDAIYCNKITFSFPIGDLAQELASSSTGILVSANPSSKWQISMTDSGVFTATPVTPQDNKITTDGLSFQIYNIQVNKKVGTFTFTVVENTSTDNITFTDKTNNYNLTKFPYGFYVNNFAASAPMVDDGKPVTLTWSGSDLGSYTILYGTESVDVTDVRTWTSPNLTATTTFSLKATVQSQGDTVDTYLYVTVIVSNPELIASSLNVLQSSTLTGATTVGSTLGVTGDTDVSNIAVSGTLGVTGATTLAGTTISDLNVTASASLAQATISSLISSGTVSMIGAAQGINVGSYTAPTDGFAIGAVSSPNENGKICRTLISCSASPGNTVLAQGGNYTAFFRWDGSSGTAWLGGLQNTCTLPVSKGASFSVSVWNDPGNEVNAPTSFYWVPIGTGTVQAPVRTGKAEGIPGLEELEMATQIVSRPPDMHDLDIKDLLEVLEDILGDHLDEGKREKLQNAIRRIVYFETKRHDKN